MPTNKTRIAIVEDNRFMSQSLGMWLEQQLNCTIVGCSEDGEAGLKMCLDLRPDLALIDIHLPKMDGLTLVGKLLKQVPGIRLVAMSGLMDPYTVWRVGQSGVHGYIVKTENLAVLLKGIQTVLDDGLFFSSIFQEVKTTWLSKPEAFQKILSDREQQILQHVVTGWEDERIGQKLDISAATVGVHRKNIRKKLDLHNDRELLGYALQWGLDASAVAPGPLNP
jgi:DNA-binding NarL/FixJ family response regulator